MVIRSILATCRAGKGAIRRLHGDRRGVTAIEYSLLAVLIAVGSIVIMGEIGVSLNGAFESLRVSMP